MNTYNKGDVIEFGPASARRVGVVIGEYDDAQRGTVLCILTPECSAKGQAFDNWPASFGGIERATIEQLQQHAQDVKAAMVARIDAYLERLPATA
jgi:hypothetical protein